MEVHTIKPHIQAVIPTQGSEVSRVGCNIGIIHTTAGIVLIDTSVSENRMSQNLEKAGVNPQDISLVIITHVHADHINGLKLFSCPVVGHIRSKRSLEKKCAKYGQELITFENRLEKVVGGLRLELFHLGGHTPESMGIWLPGEKILFSGDLVFSGTAPFLAANTNFNKLVEGLHRLSAFGAEVIIPGHGSLCDDREVQRQIHYLENTWKVIEEHVTQGHPLGVTRRDPNLPKLPGNNYVRNILWIYRRQKR